MLGLGEVAHAAVGAPAGGLLPTRASHIPPGPISAASWPGTPSTLADEVSAEVMRSIDLFRDRLAGQIDEAIGTLWSRIDNAAQCRALGDQRACQRVQDLARAAQHLTQLSERLDWMLFDDS